MQAHPRPVTGRRIAEYGIAALTGVLASWSLLFLISYFNGPYVNSRKEIARAIGLSQLGWLGPVLILIVVLLLVAYLTRLSAVSAEEQFDAEQVRCTACGQEIAHDWKLCPFCGSFVGNIRHPRDNAG